MESWNGEIFESYLNNPCFPVKVIDAGPLYVPIFSVQIKRDEKQKIILTSRSLPTSQRSAVIRPAGTVQINTNKMILQAVAGMRVILSGVTPYSDITYWKTSGESYREELSRIFSIESMSTQDKPIAKVIEWVANIDTSFVFPHRFSRKEITNISREFINTKKHITQKNSDIVSGFSSTCLGLTIAGYSLFFCLHPNHKDRHPSGSGFILYESYPDEKSRIKIRDCLSFILGRPLVYYGETRFSEQDQVVGFKAVSGYSIDEKVFSIPTMPPAPICPVEINCVEADDVEKAVNNLFSMYEQLSFEHLSWIYWHARCAPIHMQCVELAAGIEALQVAYRKSFPGAYSMTILSPDQTEDLLNPLLNSFTKTIGEMDIEAEQKRMLKNKVNGLNNLPLSVVNERFFKHLSLCMDEDEAQAWKHRHVSAHGGITDPKNGISLIHKTKILQNLFHRAVLKITNAHDEYVDYYSSRYPIKRLEESVSSIGVRFSSL
ncbi:MAG: hypothetical protein LBV61_05730 [Burkholderiaceae bacterium]|nr:hypothetical protein [Burkholderiaceae bacterium]